MITKQVKRLVLPIAVILCLSVMPFLATPAHAANPKPFFKISILGPNSNPARNQWSTIMVQQLPKIGIGVEVFDHTGWAQIYPRVFSYAGPYPIPTYAEGGYDILFVGWSWGLDWDPTGLYDSPSITPNGDNFYQYESQEMDWAISNYTSSFVLADRIDWAHQIQALLYEDLPQTTIIYPLSLYPHHPDFAGWDGLLWASNYQPMENWEIPGETEFYYACPASFVDFHIMHYESVYDAQWLRQIYNGLIQRYAEEPYQRGFGPRLAESFSSTDGITYNIVIKDDACWADGNDLTSADVLYNYQLMIDPDFGHPNLAYWLEYINNDAVEIINDKELTMTFLKPYVFQDGNIGQDLIPKHIWDSVAPEDHKAQAATWAVDNPTKLFGAGPFYLHYFDATNEIIHLKRNDYFDGWSGITPSFTDVYFVKYANREGALSALAGGTVHMVDAQFSPQIDQVPAGAAYTLVEDPGTQEMGFNMKHPVIGTGELCPIPGAESAKHIRKAISHLIPRDIIVEEIMKGLATPGVTGMPNVAVGFDESLEPYEYSIALAKQQMELAGYSYTDKTNVGLYVVIGILALTGASQVFILKRRK